MQTGAREAAFAELRAERPVSWHGPPETRLIEPEPPPRHLRSGEGVLFDEGPPEMLEAFQSFTPAA